MAAVPGWSLWLACLLVSASQEQKTITAEPEHNVTLTCQAPNINIKTVMWSRADLGERYVFLCRDEVPTTTYQHPSFKDRVEMQDRQMTGGNVSVILKNVTVNDTGTYECHVKARKEPNSTLLRIISLRVSPPPPPPPPPVYVVLIVGLVLLALLAAAAAGFVIYRKYQGKLSPLLPASAAEL